VPTLLHRYVPAAPGYWCVIRAIKRESGVVGNNAVSLRLRGFREILGTDEGEGKTETRNEGVAGQA